MAEIRVTVAHDTIGDIHMKIPMSHDLRAEDISEVGSLITTGLRKFFKSEETTQR